MSKWPNKNDFSGTLYLISIICCYIFRVCNLPFIVPFIVVVVVVVRKSCTYCIFAVHLIKKYIQHFKIILNTVL